MPFPALARVSRKVREASKLIDDELRRQDAVSRARAGESESPALARVSQKVREASKLIDDELRRQDAISRARAGADLQDRTVKKV